MKTTKNGGTQFDDLVRTFVEATETATKAKNYELTNVLGSWAKEKGYKGLIVPGARGMKDYTNIVIFEQAGLTTALSGQVPVKLK